MVLAHTQMACRQRRRRRNAPATPHSSTRAPTRVFGRLTARLVAQARAGAVRERARVVQVGAVPGTDDQGRNNAGMGHVGRLPERIVPPWPKPRMYQHLELL